ncbi:hypothetical protein VNO78_22019 [Psophocarpus tetragonolobus]|uniref:Uncharacterized protein n=1 Tax=Psophocarpus tetragonolobus TaxID=3891 RepID=A0AAN9SBU3_PSOTE
MLSGSVLDSDLKFLIVDSLSVGDLRLLVLLSFDAVTTKPILKLLKKQIHFQWNNECIKCFEKVKIALAAFLIWNRPWSSQDLWVYLLVSEGAISVALDDECLNRVLLSGLMEGRLLIPSIEVSHSKTVSNAGLFIWRNTFVAWGYCCSDRLGLVILTVLHLTAGRLAGRAIAYVQLARGQFDTVMQQSQARQVHKELQDAMAQLDAIRHEIRSISIINPGPLTRRLVDNPDQFFVPNVDNIESRKLEDSGENHSIPTVVKDSTSMASNSCNMQSQATMYARLAESPAIKNEL